MTTPKFILASASPARRRLLQSAGIEPIVQASDFDESKVQLSNPAELVQALALKKAETVAAKVEASNSPTLVMGCDSVLALHGEIHGKPANQEEAIARWQQMRGQIGELYTGHALLFIPPTPASQPLTPTPLVRCQMTRVHFASVNDREIAAYVATGEPLNCAGCFALEGKGGLFVENLEGCHSNVIGLSLPLLRQMLNQLGFDVVDFWQAEL
jgi:septum formation protein